jgi:uroporphyrinogen-III synthase
VSLLSPERRAWLQQRLLEEDAQVMKILRAIASQYPEGHEPLRREIVSRCSNGIAFTAAWEVHAVLKRLEDKGLISWRRRQDKRRPGNDRLLLPKEPAE